jgi:hypothetical protein
VKVGDNAYAFEHFNAEIDDGKRGLIVNLTVNVIDGRPRCTELALHASSGEIDKAALRALPLRSYLDAALIRASWRPGAGIVDLVFVGGTIDVRRRKRTVTDEYLHDVAKTYREAKKNPTAAVESKFDLPRSTAGRHVQLARKRGFLGAAPAERTAGEAPRTKKGTRR